MRLYIIGFMVGVIGLVAANQVRAEEGCGTAGNSIVKATTPHTDIARIDRNWTTSENPRCPENVLLFLRARLSDTLS